MCYYLRYFCWSINFYYGDLLLQLEFKVVLAIFLCLVRIALSLFIPRLTAFCFPKQHPTSYTGSAAICTVVSILFAFYSTEYAHCSGSGEGTSSNPPQAPGPNPNLPRADWEIALSQPLGTAAPDSLKDHIEGKIRLLLNMGRKRSLNKATIDHILEDLALRDPTTTVGFCRSLLWRVDFLINKHGNQGNPFPFDPKKKEHMEALSSIMWQYDPKVGL